MLACLGLHGFMIVSLVFFYIRWSDVETAADLCLFGLLVELVVAPLLVQYILTVDSVFFVHLGTFSTPFGAPVLSLVFCFDEISGFFLGILAFALIICFFFLVEYFEYDARAGSIILLSSLFSQGALLYFCAFDLLMILFFWEFLGLVSFFLVQHWAFRLSSYKAGLKVYLFSQFSDLFFFIFVFIVLHEYEVTELTELLCLLHLSCFDYFVVGPLLLQAQSTLGLLVYATFAVKAAQWFFYPWLLDAMEAPVPISAQLHSSTLVIVGFYLLFRFELLFIFNKFLSAFIMWGGVITSIGACFLAFFQHDGKRLLAASTASQLGYVSVCFSLGLRIEALLLLSLCCCGKAVTFVWFGVFMRRYRGYSDFRVVGGVSKFCWLEHAGILASLAAFTVFPGVFGWHVKALLTQGRLWTARFPTMRVGLELLDVSWFFSSLYLWALYVSLFMAPGQLRVDPALVEAVRAYSFAALRQRLVAFGRAVVTFNFDYSPFSAYSTVFLFLLWFSLVCFFSYSGFFFLTYTDVVPRFSAAGAFFSFY